MDATTGDFDFLPRGALDSFRNAGVDAARALIIIARPGSRRSSATRAHQPNRGVPARQVLAPDNQAYNLLLRSARCIGERGFALLTGRWRALRRITASLRRIGDYAKAVLVLTHIEQLQLRASC